MQAAHAASSPPLLTPPGSTKSSLTQRLHAHAGANWPQLTELADGVPRRRTSTSKVNSPTARACRCADCATPNQRPPGASRFLASSGRYEDQILPTGSFAGTPQDALDCACGLYLTGPEI